MEETTSRQITPITLDEMPDAVERLRDLREQKDAADNISKGLHDQIEYTKAQIIDCLQKRELPGFKASCGINVGLRNEFYVSQPKTPEDESAFNKWLEENDKTHLRKVNYQTLNALYREQIEAAAEQGGIVTIPGLAAPTTRVTLTVRKG